MTRTYDGRWLSVSWFRLFRGFVVLFACAAPSAAMDLQLTTADVDRALIIARGTERERERFHAPYIQQLDSPTVESIEIISEFRRVVLVAEEHILRGDRAFAYSSRLAADAVKPWSNRVGILARLRFHPLNTYVTLPDIEVVLDGPKADAALIGVRKAPLHGFVSSPDERAPLMGAIAEGVFDAAMIGRTERNVIVRVDGKTVAVAQLDFGSVE
jgi:hypothetical protein